MKNGLTDLNDHLMEMIELVEDGEDLPPEEYQKLLLKARTVSMLAERVIDNANTMLDAERLKSRMGYKIKKVPDVFLSVEEKKEQRERERLEAEKPQIEGIMDR